MAPNLGPAVTNSNNAQNFAGDQQVRLLAIARDVNVNAAGDTVLQIINSGDWSVFQVVLTGATISLTTAAAGVFTAPGAGGTAVVANAALSALTGPTIVNQRTVASTVRQTGDYLYFNVATPQGAAATVDVLVYGYDFSSLPSA